MCEADIAAALTAFYKGTRTVTIKQYEKTSSGNEGKDGTDSKSDDKGNSDSDITIFSSEYAAMEKKLKDQEKHLATMEKKSSKAIASITQFTEQQKQLFDEFVLLRSRYDEQRTQLLDLLWTKCIHNHAELTGIPDQEDDDFTEEDNVVGVYNISEKLGEGMFAHVKSCSISHSRGDPLKHDFNAEYAMKILDKDKLLSFHNLKRVRTIHALAFCIYFTLLRFCLSSCS